MPFTKLETIPSDSYPSAGQVMTAFLISISIHSAIFLFWPNIQRVYIPPIIVDGELTTPEPLPSPIEPEEPPVIEPEKTPIAEPQIKQVNQPPEARQQALPDVGVALPVLADKSAGDPSPADYTVADTAPLNPDDKLPFGSKSGNVSIKDYTPSNIDVGEPGLNRSGNPDADDEVDQGELSTFASMMRDAAARLGSYPAVATKRGWQGKTKVLVRFNTDGTPRFLSIHQSSGHKVLDEKALEMVKLALVGIQIPAKLSSKKFSVIVPVDFKLQ